MVDTTNFTDKTHFHGSDRNLHLIERFKLLDPNTIQYRFTVDDPTAFVKPWTGEIILSRTPGPSMSTPAMRAITRCWTCSAPREPRKRLRRGKTAKGFRQALKGANDPGFLGVFGSSLLLILRMVHETLAKTLASKRWPMNGYGTGNSAITVLEEPSSAVNYRVALFIRVAKQIARPVNKRNKRGRIVREAVVFLSMVTAALIPDELLSIIWEVSQDVALIP